MTKYYIACRKKGGTILSYLIRLCTLSKYSHCYLLLNKDEYVEADGFKSLSIGKITQDRVDEYDFFELLSEYEKQCDYKAMDKYINEVLGSEYGYIDLVTLAFSKASGIWQRLIRRFLPHTKEKIICSEFIARCYHEAGVCLFDEDEEFYCKLPSPNQISKSKKLRKLTEEEKQEIFK